MIRARLGPGFPSREAFRRVHRRWQRTLVFSAVVGVTTGACVAGFEFVTADLLLDRLLSGRAALWVVVPGVGLVLAALALRYVGHRATPVTSDEYVSAYHDRTGIDRRLFPGRLLASAATLGSGCALGFEGPSIYMGAGIGSAVAARFRRLFTRDDATLLMVAGAAAGVSAIFKAPATGAVFALEVPYQEDTASHAVLPALVASASSYLTYIAFYGTAPLLDVRGNPLFDARDVAGSVVLGLLAGLAARAFVAVMARARHHAVSAHPVLRIAVGAVGMAATTLVAIAVYDEPLTLGPGYQAIQWSLEPRHAFGIITLLFVLRAVATTATIAGGGVSGIFIPLVVQGWLLGAMFEAGLPTRTTLFPVIGAAAFLGAGYRTPIAAVVFVSEATGRAGYIVPALVATAIAQLVMGRHSICDYQRPRREGHLERRLDFPVSEAVDEAAPVRAPSVTVGELVQGPFADPSVRAVAIVDGGRYLGIVRVADVLSVAPSAWERDTAADVMHRDVPVVTPEWSLGQTVRAMAGCGRDRLPVVDDGVFVGLVTRAAVVEIERVLSDGDGD